MTDILTFQNHGQERDLICTEEEREIFHNVCGIIAEAGLNPDLLKFVRKSDNYVSIVMESEKYGSMDVARVKYTNRSKWIWTQATGRVSISHPSDVASVADELAESFRFNSKYL